MLVTSPEDFDYLEIGLASPDKIRFWSHGEVEKPETINYRTFKPERKGLFCEKIFGPVKDWECACGKYRRVRYRGIVCERCGVQVTHSKVRRERMGHIELASPVSHIWFLKGIPGYMGILLDMSTRQLEEIIYYDSYVVTEVEANLSSEESDLQVQKLLSSESYYDFKDKYGDRFRAEMGAKAIRDLLATIDLSQLVSQLRHELVDAKGQKRLKVTKRLKIVEALQQSGNRPEWMILDVIPVMPPDLRPMVQLEGGRFATSDLNDLYRRVVNRNNRLKRLIDIGAPEMIVRNEKRMLQEAVDVLISNGKRGRAVTGSNGRPLKSLGNIIEGKQGRFRQNLLGKRVDYSGRSVIVVGPHLKFHQCGLPKEMALELFKPFVIRKLVEEGYVTNVKSAKRKIEKRDVYVWDVLEEIIKGQPVLLNRAPTLHRLGIQAFEPILVEGSAIQVHPLVCTAFNADFDGDQMAVHVPLSLEAQAECRLLVMSTNNILSPSNGRAIITPTQDMVLGCYFLTVPGDTSKGTGRDSIKTFRDTNDALRAWEAKIIDYHTEINLKLPSGRVKTTVGRVIFNDVLTKTFEKYSLSEPYINKTVGKKELSALIFDWYLRFGSDIVSELADALKNLGFKYATLSGISISISDLRVPKKKAEILARAEEEIIQLEKLETKKVISSGERVLRSHDVWRRVTSDISDQMESEFGRLNNVFIMANSGARGNIDQVRQLAGMRGLMSDAQGRTITVPIKSNFKEGLSLAEYFISCYGARKGLVDTALRTADSGYLTRRLVDVAQDVVITEDDCGTADGMSLAPLREGLEIIVSLAEMIEGRVSLKDVLHPQTKQKLVRGGEIISHKIASEIQASGVESVPVRSIYCCKTERGICQKCYGLDLATGRLINLGEAVGIIAAQSIGEPGTQLTMRTFHTGGVDLRKASQVAILSKDSGKLVFDEGLALSRIQGEDGGELWITTNEGRVYIQVEGQGNKMYPLPRGSHLVGKAGASIKEGDLIAELDPRVEYVISSAKGIAKFVGLDPYVSKDAKGKVTDISAQKDAEIFVYDSAKKREFEVGKELGDRLSVGSRLAIGTEIGNKEALEGAAIVVEVKKNQKTTKAQAYSVVAYLGCSYPVNAGARLYVEEGDKIGIGDTLAKERIRDDDASKTKDIVQGLPRVEELFEGRRPREHSILSEISGTADVLDKDGARLLIVRAEDGSQSEHRVPRGIRLKVFAGKSVEKGEELTEGVISPHDLIITKGVEAAQKYLVDEVQRVYRSQGVSINNKHVEVIVRQMTRKVNILTMGDSEFLPNELVDVRRFEKTNEQLMKAGKQPATCERILLGITRASLSTESFISASSFQETAKVLSRAAIYGDKDEMYGLKENVIIGKLIPAGTGFMQHKDVSLKSSSGEDIVISEEKKVFSPVEEEVAVE